MTTNRRALTALSLLLLASLGLAACGGGDDTNASTSTSTSAEPLTKSELAATADQLCTEMSQRVSDRAEIPDFGKDGLQSDELEAAYPFFAARAEEGQALVDELDGLKPPQAIAADWNDFVAMMQTSVVDYANDLAAPAKAGNTHDFFEIGLEAQSGLTQLDRSAQALGLDVCGASSLPSS